MIGHGGGGRAARRCGTWNRRYTRWRKMTLAEAMARARWRKMTLAEAADHYPQIRLVAKTIDW